jgi:hypothetical protein
MKRLAILLAAVALAGCASHRYPSSSGYSSSGSNTGSSYSSAGDAMSNGNGNDMFIRNGAASGVYVPDTGTYGYGGP